MLRTSHVRWSRTTANELETVAKISDNDVVIGHALHVPHARYTRLTCAGLKTAEIAQKLFIDGFA
jgi:hypothetical protein